MAAIDEQMRAFEARLNALESRITSYGNEPAPPPPLFDFLNAETPPVVSPAPLPVVEPATPPDGPVPGESLSEWVSALMGDTGIVADPGLARSTPCLEVELGGGDHLIFSRGVIGPLDEGQQALYCQNGTVPRPLSEPQRTRVGAMREASRVCKVADYEEDEHPLDGFFSCMGRELRAQNADL